MATRTQARGVAAFARITVAMLCMAQMMPANSVELTDRAQFDADVEAVFARYHLPGIAAGLIKNGEVAYVHTAGELIAGSGRPVTRDTLFKIGSNTKAMTASVLARLVDAGKLRWDDPVNKYLPKFRMYDAWVTQNMQVRDLLLHDSGLPEGGGDLMLWPEPNNFSRADILAGLAHIRPAYSFRSGYAYDNLLYIVAGEVAAAAGGASYEELVRREVLLPLGLSHCRVGEFRRDEVGPIAQPHTRQGGSNVLIKADQALVPAISSAAAGGIRCSLDDMLHWARNWLAPTGQQLKWLSASQRREMWMARTPMPISQRHRDWDQTHFYAYAFGFRLADSDGAWTVSHTGTLSGMYSAMVLLPDLKSGFVFMINGDGDAARTVLTEVLLKRLTVPGRVRSVTDYADELEHDASAPSRLRAPDMSARAPATGAQLQPWLGIWRDPWFGEVSLCEHQGDVRFLATKSPLMRGRVMSVGSRWLVDWDEVSMDAEAWLEFSGGTGTAMLRMAKVDPDADSSFDYEDLAFERIGACDTVSPATVADQVGLVDIASLIPDIELEIRYAGSDNFVGVRIDGYLAPKCLLLRPVAEALERVNASLRARQLRLKLFDCYRPVRAVRHFMRWAGDIADQRTKSGYYPNLDKQALIGDYIAPVSGHSRGGSVDLTLLSCADQRCQPLDMGTDFDFFDPRANTASPVITEAQRNNRELLREAMAEQGFADYPYEWWHFTHHPESVPRQLYDVSIR